MTSDSASRVTRSSRRLRLTLLLFAGVLAGQAVLHAQEPPAASDAAPATTPSQPEAEPAPADGADGTGAPRAAEEAATAVPPPAGPSPGRFEPTEKVRADFDVSFPIDI
jgi:hypothetical protein